MDKFIFDQVSFVRQATLKAVENLSESQISVVPEGFNNNILWNLGHIYLVQERFVYQIPQKAAQIPNGFLELFGQGTKPSEWNVQPPALSEVLQVLKEQPTRIKEMLKDHLRDELPKPFTLPSGLTFNTIGELLTFSMYHEGMHVQTIKMLKRFSER